MSDRRGNKSLPNSGNFGGSSSSKKNRPDKARSSDNQVNGGGRAAKSQFTLAQIVSGAHLNNASSKKPSKNQSDQSKKMASSNPSQATDSETHKFNAEVCKRMDPEFFKILKVASQVAIFDYDCQAKKWASKDILGCLFFYERKAAPRYGLSILNRKSLNNFVLLLKPDMQLQVEEPHILIRDDETINCLWFYNQSECNEIAEEVNRRQKQNLQTASAEMKPQEQVVPQQSSQDQSGNQILNILCQKLMASTVAEAKNNTVAEAVVTQSQPKEQTRSSALQALLGLAPNVSVDNGKATTEEQPTSNASGQPPKKLDSLGDELRATLGIINKLDSSWQPDWNVNNGGCHGDNGTAGDKILSDFGEQGQSAYGNPGGYFKQPQQAALVYHDIHNPHSAFVKTGSLQSFESRNTGGYNPESTSICGSANEMHSTALNKEQMLRAFSYLLDTDPDFTERLHQAYLRSFERS